ncbi:MAG: ribose ABC transporter permease [Firmicutes bacterium]|nr:ribose ABC transporter permease [Bacillota bacterium]
MKKSFLQKYGIVIVLVGICVVLSFMSPVFLTVSNLTNVVRQISMNGILAAGMTMVIITAGIDLSVGSQVALTGAIVAGLQPHGTWVAVFAGLLLGAFLGFTNGFIISKGGIPPFIVSVGMLTAARGLTLIYTGGRPIYDLNEDFRFIGAGYAGPIPVPVIILAVVLLICHFLLSSTVFGREVYAIGGNEEAARYSGIDIDKRRMTVYTIMGILCAITGIVLTSRLNSADPTAGMGFELDAIAAVIIGGTSLFGGEGTILGTLIGALIIGVLNNGFNLLNVSSYYQQIFKGVIIVGAVLMDSYARKRQVTGGVIARKEGKAASHLM